MFIARFQKGQRPQTLPELLHVPLVKLFSIATIPQVQKYQVPLLPRFHKDPQHLPGFGLSSLA